MKRYNNLWVLICISAAAMFLFSWTAAASEKESKSAKENKKKTFSVCIDPGHQGSSVDMSAPEPVGPGSDEMKAKATTGTQGNYTGVPEYQLNLDISLMLEEELTKRGYRVVMTRRDNDTAISNSERALLASEENCDIMVRIHANSSEDTSVSGALAMTMSRTNPYTADLFEDSYRLALNILNSYCLSTGFTNLGVQAYDNMTGINWSRVPVMILEMGYMSNEKDDWAMQNEETRKLMITGIADGIDTYFGVDKDKNGSEGSGTGAEGAGKLLPGEEETEDLMPGEERVYPENEEESESEIEVRTVDPLIDEIRKTYLDEREKRGQIWSVSIERLSGNDKAVLEYNGFALMQSASVIKVFIMAAVLDRSEETDAQTDSLLESMITVSDNDAANRLVELIGDGDFHAGSIALQNFCMENGYLCTSIGRRFLESNPTGDNDTSAGDCRKILADIYKGKCVSKSASEKMLGLLMRQTRRGKIPSGLPEGYRCGNKTGEMPEGYGLGCIENDMAIVFSPDGDYVLAVLSNELGGDNDGAARTISGISSLVAEKIYK